MISDFKFVALEKEQFNSLMELSDQTLSSHQAKWMVVDEEPGYPCRVSLEDAKIGERVLFMPYWHHDVKSAYRAMGTILVRERAQSTEFEVNQVPKMLNHRLLSVKVYNSSNMMIAHDLVKGNELEAKLKRQFQNSSVAYVHLHYASPGCFCSAVYRACKTLKQDK